MCNFLSHESDALQYVGNFHLPLGKVPDAQATLTAYADQPYARQGNKRELFGRCKPLGGEFWLVHALAMVRDELLAAPSAVMSPSGDTP